MISQSQMCLITCKRPVTTILLNKQPFKAINVIVTHELKIDNILYFLSSSSTATIKNGLALKLNGLLIFLHFVKVRIYVTHLQNIFIIRAGLFFFFSLLKTIPDQIIDCVL